MLRCDTTGGWNMARNEHEINIACPVERVFSFVTDFRTWRHWHGSENDEVARLTDGPIGIGTVWKVSGSVRNEVITVTLEVTDYDPYRKYGFKTTDGPIQAEQTFTFEPIEQGTRLRTILELVNPALAEPARRQWDKDLVTLKELLETQA
jgi:uncharacterized protein YndB with AHSA1/START domain